MKKIDEELRDAKCALEEKKLLHEDCISKVSYLEKSICDHVGSRETRLKDLEKTIKDTRSHMQSALKDLKVGILHILASFKLLF